MTAKKMKKLPSMSLFPVLFAAVSFVLVCVFVGYSMNAQRLTPDTQAPKTLIVDNSENMRLFRGTTLPISFTHSNQLHVYEETKEGRGYGIGITVLYGELENENFLQIKKTLLTNFSNLKALKIGEKYFDKTSPDETIFATRLADTIIGGKTALVYEWNKLWEVHGPVREYFIPFQESYLHIRVTYSNAAPGNDDGKFDYLPAYDQILSTLSFTN